VENRFQKVPFKMGQLAPLRLGRHRVHDQGAAEYNAVDP
jgi:hypothetical protein